MGITVRGLCPLIQVFDMPRSLHFYRDVLGFEEVQKSGEGDVRHEAAVREGSRRLWALPSVAGREPSPTKGHVRLRSAALVVRVSEPPLHVGGER